ncbi:MAG: hypothetical protein IIC73_02775 [Armatimonadetes bacterium]|nr:hypothetical protein [Armatimonadota bacterium]
MTALIALALIAQPQTVTFTHPGAHSSVVLKALGQELDLTLKPSGSVNKDYFLVRFDDVPVQEALDMVAKTLNATWTQRDGVRYLGRTRQQELEDERKDAEPLLREHERHFKNKIVPPEFTTDLVRDMLPNIVLRRVSIGVTRREGPANVPLLPGFRALDKLVRSLQKETILGFEDQKATVLTRNDVPAWDDAYRDLASECDVLSSYASLIYDPTKGPVSARTWSRRTSPITKMELVVSRRGSSAGYNLTYGGRDWSTTNSLRYPNAGFIRSRNDPLWSDMTGPYEYRETGKLIMDYLLAKKKSEGHGPVQPPEQLVEYLFELEENSLLGPLVGDVWLELMRTKGLNGVVVIPDSALTYVLDRPDQQVSVSRILAYSAKRMDVEVTGSTLTAVPSAPHEARERRYDRKATVKYIRALVRKNRVIVDDLATFVTSQENIYTHSTADRVAKIVMPMAADRSFGFYRSSSKALAVYGRLNTIQRKAAWQGGVNVELRSVPKRMMEALNDVFLNSYMRLVPDYKPVDHWRYTFSSPGAALLANAVGDSLPANATVRVAVVREMKLSPQQPIESRITVITAPKSVQEFAVASKNRGFRGGSELNYTKALWSQMARVEVSLYIPGHGYSTVSTIVDERSFDDKYVDLKELPASVQRDLTAAGMKIGEVKKR